MKRSTVIKLLASEISKTNTGHYSYDSTEHAKRVLAFIEELGMLPPWNNRYEEHSWTIENEKPE